MPFTSDHKNEFSAQWYSLFMDTMPREGTESEVALVERFMPVAQFPRILDVCCGSGRHSLELADRGHSIVGIDSNPAAVAQARAAAQGRAVRFEVADMRALAGVAGDFDGVVNLWHSFGYFSDEENAEVVRQIRAKLRLGGRFILDIYNREHFALVPRIRIHEKDGIRVETEYAWNGKRMSCELRYPNGEHDLFEWRLYTPDEVVALAAETGFRSLLTCAWCTPGMAPSSEHARMQFVLERLT